MHPAWPWVFGFPPPVKKYRAWLTHTAMRVQRNFPEPIETLATQNCNACRPTQPTVWQVIPGWVPEWVLHLGQVMGPAQHGVYTARVSDRSQCALRHSVLLGTLAPSKFIKESR